MPKFDITEIKTFMTALEETDDVTTAEFSEAYTDIAFSLFLKGLQSYIDSFQVSRHFPESFSQDIGSYIFSTKSYDEATTQNFRDLYPKLDQFLKANKLLRSRIEKTISKKQKLVPPLVKKFHKHFREILLEYYLNAPPREWTPKNTQEIFEIYKQNFLSSVSKFSKSNIEPSLDIFSWDETQKHMMHNIDRYAQLLNSKKQELKIFLESHTHPALTTIPDNILELAEKEWNNALKEIFKLDLDYKYKKYTKPFINHLKKTISDEKSIGLSDDNAKIVDMFFKKSEIGIIKFILDAKIKDSKGIQHDKSPTKLLALLANSLYKQLSHTKELEPPRIEKYLKDHYLKFIEDLFKLAPETLHQKHEILLQKQNRINSAKELLTKYLAHYTQEPILDGFKTTPLPEKLEELFRRHADDLPIRRKDREPFNSKKYIQALLEFSLQAISENMEKANDPSHSLFLELINHSTDAADIRSEIHTYLYDEYGPIIRNVLQEVYRTKKSTVPIPPATIVDVVDLENFEIEADIPEIQKQFVKKITQLLKEEIPNMRYNDYKKAYPNKHQAWYNDSILNRVRILRTLIKEHTPTTLSDDSNAAIEARIEALFKQAVDAHDAVVNALERSSEAPPHQENIVPKKPRA